MPATAGRTAADAPAAAGSVDRPVSECRRCGAHLATDQRYCVECGTRRWALPGDVLARIAGPAAGSSATAEPAVEQPDADARGESAAEQDAWIPWLASLPALPALSPAAAAALITGVLGFGVLVGAAVSPTGQSDASGSPIVVALTQPAHAKKAKASTAPESSEAAGEGSQASASEEGGSSEATKATSATATETKTKGKSPAGTAPSGSGAPAAGGGTLPPIKHVFLVVLSGQGYDTAFGAASKSHYLASTLRKQGELLQNYYATSAGELANAIALISGQGPTPQTATDCPLYSDIAPGTFGSDGQVLGSGCVYPAQTLTLADQLAKAGKTWKAYIEGLGDTGGAAASCRHPAVGEADPDNAPRPGEPYVTWRNPFVYFQSLTGGESCARNDVGVEELPVDLASAASTPSFSYIAPDPCHDGAEEPCAPGQPAGMPAADAFLERVIPKIEASPAYQKEGGLIAITFDEAPQSGPDADSTGCCISSPFPNMPAITPEAGTAPASTPEAGTTPASTPATAGAEASEPGGGRVGLLLISKYVKPGSTNSTGQYDHFSLLRSIDELFGLTPLGYAGARGLLGFDASIYNAYR